MIGLTGSDGFDGDSLATLLFRLWDNFLCVERRVEEGIDESGLSESRFT